MMETPTDSQREMPRYKSHKTVWALKIATVELHAANGHILYPEDKRYAPFRVPDDYIQKHNPQPGGYYVLYEDGYKSFSPAKAFEEGYTAVKVEAITQAEGAIRSLEAQIKAIDYRDRVRAEKDELDERITKLSTFIGSIKFSELPELEQVSLRSQRQAMVTYSNVLAVRIDRFPA